MRTLVFIAMLASIPLQAAEQAYLGVRCHTTSAEDAKSISLFYLDHPEPTGEFRFMPSYTEVISNSGEIFQTCVRGPNRAADKSTMLVQMMGSPNFCNIEPGSFALKQLYEIDGTRTKDSTGEKFEAEFRFRRDPDDGQRFVENVTCTILPITKSIH